MLPEYIIYDELKRQREREQREDRPHLEIPRYMPYWPDDKVDDEGEREERERGSDVVIIQM